MVKPKLSRPKIKLSKKSKSKAGDVGDPSGGADPTSSGTRAADIRAQYYASRSAGAAAGPSSASSGGPRPAAASSSSNPFGDSSSDDGGDDPLGGFARRAGRPRTAPAAAGANPFDDDDDSPSSRGGGGGGSNPFDDDEPPGPPPPAARRPSNPFGDSDGEEDGPGRPAAPPPPPRPPPSSNGTFGGEGGEQKQPRRKSKWNKVSPSKVLSKGKSTRSSGAAGGAGTGTNPFGDENDDAGPRPAAGAPQNRSTNPFGDGTPGGAAGEGGNGAAAAAGGGGGTNGRQHSDPFAAEMRGKRPTFQGKSSPDLRSSSASKGMAAAGGARQQQTAGASGRPGPPPRPASARVPSANPFDDDDEKAAPPVPKPLVSKSQPVGRANPNAGMVTPAKGGGGGAGASAPPRKNRWGAFGGGESAIPPAADEDEPGQQTDKAAGLASWLRLNKREDELNGGGDRAASAGVGRSASSRQPGRPGVSASSGGANGRSNGGSGRPRRVKKAKCRVISPWPFDSYHEVQQRQYEELASRAASEYSLQGGGRDSPRGYDDGGDDGGIGRRAASASAVSGLGGTFPGASPHGDDSKYYERPDDLPSIKEAVVDLPLVDFEKRAQDRAINIVSTWLFDAGLIDELLVNGGLGMNQRQGRSVPSAAGAGGMSSNSTVTSERTSEGQEIGPRGFLVGGAGAEHKMDKEVSKLRTMVSRDLSIINARLNDGVAASGLEVQELVNAVSATQDDIGRLRELTTYISDGTATDRDEFLLARYPHLRRAINARRNIGRCFRELEFFAFIPSTCERLRDELHGGEWTAEEWSTIRNVSMEHVELEVMLVEAENSMKGAHNFNDAVVDSFLDGHVQNVWELGEEIRMRIIAGMGDAFELSTTNPAGMVALVEAVEVYERAAESFERKRKMQKVAAQMMKAVRPSATDAGGGGKLRFTNMRAAALEQLYQDFEMRGVDMFRGVHESAADDAEEDDAANQQFTAILRAATELVTEIDIVKNQMKPCFAPHWHIEALWSSCVAHVCSNHIVQQIGGPDGQNLPELTITQLLELVAWVEYFRETIEETFPEVASMRDTKKTYFEERPELFDSDKRSVNMQNATDSLAWVNNMLWEVHRLAQEEFLVRTRSQTDEWLDKVYGSDTVKNQSNEGKLTTSLCEDVYSFSSVQLRTIRERLSKKSDALILAVCIILSHMRSKQVHARNNFLEDLETCCAASNDFTRMSEKCEDMIAELMDQCEFSEDMVATIDATSNELMAVYSSDAVYSARSVHIYVFDPIEEEIGVRLFEEQWEAELVDNDLALSLVRTLEDFHEDLEQYMDNFMVVKSVMSLMSATTIFYAKCLLQRAEMHRSNKKPYFGDVRTALDRMTGDIRVMRDYFDGLVPTMPSLKKNIEKDFEILTTIHELMSIAAGFSVSEAEDFILVLQKRVRDVGITKHIAGDLWHLVQPTEERYVWELVESMEEQLVAIAPVDDALALEVNDRSYVKGLRLDEMAVKLYVKSRRNRPVKATAVESIVNNWRTNWGGGDEVAAEEE